jgi:hypothetical protein
MQYDSIKKTMGFPSIAGSIREDFESGCSAKETIAAATESMQVKDRAVLRRVLCRANGEAAKSGLDEVDIGKLFVLQILTERILHECIMII